MITEACCCEDPPFLAPNIFQHFVGKKLRERRKMSGNEWEGTFEN